MTHWKNITEVRAVLLCAWFSNSGRSHFRLLSQKRFPGSRRFAINVFRTASLPV